MIRPVLSPACYTDPKWFELEQEKIFKKLWVFVGLTQQLEAENSFITRELSGISVLVQNLGGELRAFRNACAHRGMPIQIAEYGTRKLICSYHGWSYDDKGQLRGIPNAKIYEICDAKKLTLQLHSYALHRMGNFVFVNLSENPPPITDQFSADLIRLLEGMSAHFAQDVSYTRFMCNYNWKLNFENILDWHHVQFVHQKTLAPLLQVEEAGPDSTPLSAASKLFQAGAPLANVQFSNHTPSKGSVDIRDLSHIGRVPMPYSPRWFSKLYESPCDIGAFLNCNIFPNLNFGSIHGENFYLQQYVPVAADRIEYHSWVFTTRLKEDVPPQPHLLWGIHHGEKRVIDEDVVLLEVLQKNLSSASSVGVMGEHEAILAAMGRWYMQRLTGAES